MALEVAADLQARVLASELAPILGQPVVVINKPGATGTIMLDYVARSNKDGYTIGLTPGSMAVAPYVMKVPFDISKDFTYLAAISGFKEGFVVRSDAPWKTLPDLISYARKNPGKLNIGVAESASSVMLLAQMVGKQAGITWTPIPYGGDAKVVLALLSGTVDAAVCTGTDIPYVRQEKFRRLANATEARLKEFPEVPTLRDLGYDLASFTLSGIVGPQGLSEPVVQKLRNALSKARDTPKFQETLTKMSLQPEFEVGKAYADRMVKQSNLIGTFLKQNPSR